MDYIFGLGVNDLVGRKLLSREKDQLADLVINKVMKSKDVAQRFNISVNSLRYYTFRRRASIRNHDYPKRPRKLDEISDQTIKALIQNNEEDIRLRLKSIIKVEAKNSYMRRFPDFVDSDRRRSLFISHRSIERYYTIYMNFYSILYNNNYDVFEYEL
jgi:hypothetical protein